MFFKIFLKVLHLLSPLFRKALHNITVLYGVICVIKNNVFKSLNENIVDRIKTFKLSAVFPAFENLSNCNRIIQPLKFHFFCRQSARFFVKASSQARVPLFQATCPSFYQSAARLVGYRNCTWTVKLYDINVTDIRGVRT